MLIETLYLHHSCAQFQIPDKGLRALPSIIEALSFKFFMPFIKVCFPNQAAEENQP
jgi:hypothetical protein